MGFTLVFSPSAGKAPFTVAGQDESTLGLDLLRESNDPKETQVFTGKDMLGTTYNEHLLVTEISVVKSASDIYLKSF